jgi:hypothetical protein
MRALALDVPFEGPRLDQTLFMPPRSILGKPMTREQYCSHEPTANDDACQREQPNMNLKRSLKANAQLAEVGQPVTYAIDDPPIAAEFIAAFDAPRAIRAVISSRCSASQQLDSRNPCRHKPFLVDGAAVRSPPGAGHSGSIDSHAAPVKRIVPAIVQAVPPAATARVFPTACH